MYGLAPVQDAVAVGLVEQEKVLGVERLESCSVGFSLLMEAVRGEGHIPMVR